MDQGSEQMGINIGIDIGKSPKAPCREYRAKIIKIHAGPEYKHLMDMDLVVPLDKAKATVGDWEAFLKRNRLSEDIDSVYIEKIKKNEDLDSLTPLAEEIPTGWITMDNLPEDERKTILASVKDDVVTGWDMLSFEEMEEMCSSCTLSWDKGRGCIGAFGPDNSLLPEIASRYACPIVASVPESVKTGRIFDIKDAESLLKECEILEKALPEEGKMMVRRYAGPVERMRAAAKASIEGECGFYFF